MWDNVFCAQKQNCSLRRVIDLFSYSFQVFCCYKHLPSFSKDQKSILDHPFNIKSGRYLDAQQTQNTEVILRSFLDDGQQRSSLIFNVSATDVVSKNSSGTEEK